MLETPEDGPPRAGQAFDFSSVAGRYLTTRFRPDERRDDIWVHIVRHLARWWRPDASILDVGAGYCSFINAASAQRRVAVDLHGELDQYAAPGVECVNASATALPFEDGEFDVVFASNLLEHLTRSDILRALDEFRRVTSRSGRLILIQPNYRLCASKYFDDFTHLTPLSHVSLADMLEASGLKPLHVEHRFLPLTMKSRLSGLSFLIPLYLRSPVRPLAGQMLFVSHPC